MPATPVTFKHLVAGSTVIMQKGKVCRFMGKPGSIGFYATEDAEEIAFLDGVCASPVAQLERAASETDAAISKPIDPSIAQSAQDAAENTMREATPEVAAARDKLATVIAASKGK